MGILRRFVHVALVRATCDGFAAPPRSLRASLARLREALRAIPAIGFALLVALALSAPALAQTNTYPLLQQQGSKMAGTGATGVAAQGTAVAISADGNTAVVGGPADNSNAGGAWIFKRSGSTWTQQGSELIGTGATGAAKQGSSVAISGDGTVAIIGGPADNSNAGAVWIFAYTSDEGWTQLGTKLVGTGATGAAAQGTSVSLSGDGTVAMVGGPNDNSNAGAVWVFTYNGISWSQSGNKLVGTGATGAAQQGASVSLASSGLLAVVGGPADNSGVGAAWIWTRTDTWASHKIVGTANTGASAQGSSVAMSGDGWVAAIGGPSDNSSAGTIWVFTRTPDGFTQQTTLTGGGETGAGKLGSALALSRDGGVILAGGTADNSNNGAAWVFGRTGVANWAQQNTKYLASDAGTGGKFASGVGISADANAAIFGASNETSGAGAIWAYNDDVVFGSVNVGANTTQTIAIQPQSNFTIGGVVVGIESFGKMDFTTAASQTGSNVCTAPNEINGDTPTCSITIKFAPTAPGVRMGAIQIFDDEEDLEATVYVYGVGVAPQLGFFGALINTVAGNGTAGDTGDGGLATQAELSSPYGVSTDPVGDLFIADYENSAVRLVNASTGLISTIAGTLGTSSFSGDGGLATSATMDGVDTPELDGAGNLYLMDYLNRRLRIVSPNTGIINTYAGNGTFGDTGDGGLATSAEIGGAYSEMIANNGDVYIAHNYSNVVRRISAITGIITTVAGTGTQDYSGDGGPAIVATLDFPVALAMDPSGNLYISDDGNEVVREINYATGTINTVVGNADNGGSGFSGDGGPASSAQVNDAEGLSLDAAGDLYITDSGNNAVREVNVITQIINSIAGNGNLEDEGYSGDGGPSTAALLAYPVFGGFDGAGNFYFSDDDNNVIRVIGGAPLLNFGTIDVGTTSDPQNIGITNTGNANLSISALTVSANFTLEGEGTTCTSSTTLSPGQSCVLSVQFAPQSVGTLQGTVTFTNNGSGAAAQQQMPLTGISTAAETSIVLISSNESPDNGQPVTFTATITPTPTGTPAGIVYFCVAPTGPIAVIAGSAGSRSSFVPARGGNVAAHDLLGNSCPSSTLIGASNVVSGVATLITASLPAGSDSVIAIYTGNATFSSSISDPVDETVSSTDYTAVTLVASPNPAAQGQSAAFIATLTPAPTGSSLGSVAFCLGPLGAIASPTLAPSARARQRSLMLPDGSSSPCGVATLLGIINLSSSGAATFTTSELPLGSNLITAIYSGNSTFASSISNGITEVINTLTGTTTTLTASPNPASAGQTVTFTAAVSPAPTGSPLGTITFCEAAGAAFPSLPLAARARSAARNRRTAAPAPRSEVNLCGSGTTLSTADVDSSGGATFTGSKATAGSMTVTAYYSGNEASDPSNSSPVTEAVNPAYTVTAPQTPFDVAEGGSVEILVNVPPLGGAFNSSVTLTASGLPQGATATFNPAAVTPGSTGAQTTMTVTLAGAQSAKSSAVRVPGNIAGGRIALLLAYLCALCGIFACGLRRGARRRLATLVLLFAACAAATWMLSACSGGFLGVPNTPKGSYTITITGTSGSLSPSTTVTLVVQ